MAGWHHWLDRHESEWTPGVGDGQGGLACCDSWGCKELDTTERLIWSETRFESQHMKYLQRDREDTENKKQVFGDEGVGGSHIKSRYATMDKDLKR